MRIIEPILLSLMAMEKSHRSSSCNLANQHRKRRCNSACVKLPHKEWNLSLLINGEFSGGLDVLQTFCLELSAIAEVNILRLLLDDRGRTLLDTCRRLGVECGWKIWRWWRQLRGQLLRQRFDRRWCRYTSMDAVSGVTTSGTTGNPATVVPRRKRPLRDVTSSSVERFEDGDDNCEDNFWGNVSIDNGVDTQACNAVSGVTTSGTTGYSATIVPRGKRPLRDVTSSSDLLLTSLRLAMALGMIVWLELMLFRSSFFFCDWIFGGAVWIHSFSYEFIVHTPSKTPWCFVAN
jgi:hypothetical protein